MESTSLVVVKAEGEPWRVEVEADHSGIWYSNQITYASKAEADAAGKDLFQRWTAVRQWRTVPVSTPLRQAVAPK